jgi:N-carbamoylputrescine amidase
MSKIKLALIQQKFHKSKDETIKYTLAQIKKVVEDGANLVMLQELHTSQYFCQSANENNFIYANYFEQEKQLFSDIAKIHKIVLVVSLFEKRATGIYHNTAVVFDTDGSEAGFYRKMHIPDDPGFYEKFYFTPSSDGFNPIKTSLGTLGVLICWDQWYPEAARIMAMKGADILIYPTAIGWFDSDSEAEKERQKEAWITIQRSHAVANGIPVVAINRVGFEADDSKVIDGIRFWGNSFVAGPQGEILIQGSSDKEENLLLDIDLVESKNVRKMWPFFRDRRIEYFSDLTKRYID